MKKVIAVMFAAVMLFSAACAETDLSGLSYDELVDLQKKISTEIMSRPEWKAVEIPIGEWIVGKDIPEGYYSIIPQGSLVIVNGYSDGIKSLSNVLFTYVLSEDENVGKVFLPEGCLLENSRIIKLAPPVSIGF